MKWSRILLALPILMTGCTTAKLRTSTVNQAGSLAELQYQQVLNNLAMFCANPDLIPSMVNLKDGSAQIADVGSASYLGDWHRAFSSHPMLMGSRTVVEQWGMSPVTDDNELQLIQIAYQRAIGIDETLEENRDLANDLAHELVKQLPEVDDYRGSIPNQYEDYKNYARRKSAPLSMFMPQGILEYVIDPGAGYFASNPRIQRNGPNFGSEDSLYAEFQAHSLSTVDKMLIYDNEIIRLLQLYTNYEDTIHYKGKEYYVNRQEILYDFNNEKMKSKLSWNKLSPPRPAPFDPINKAWKFFPRIDSLGVSNIEIFYVTPEAATVRRLVKEVELDLLEITCDRSWYGRGSKHAVPHDACFVGHYGNCYVWVCPNGIKDLSTLTIKTLKFSHLIKDDAVLTVPGPRYTPASGFPSH